MVFAATSGLVHVTALGPEPKAPIAAGCIGRQRIAQAIRSGFQRPVLLQERRAGNQDQFRSAQKFRLQPRIFSQPVTNGNIDRLAAQIDQPVASLNVASLNTDADCRLLSGEYTGVTSMA